MRKPQNFHSNLCYIRSNFQMSEKSSTIPTHTIKAPPCISTPAETTEREKRQVDSRETSDEVKEEETWIETQSNTMRASSLQQVMVKGNNISYGSLPRPPVCNANQYGNCIKPVDENNRPCTVYNKCKRDNPWSESISEF